MLSATGRKLHVQAQLGGGHSVLSTSAAPGSFAETMAYTNVCYADLFPI